MSSLSRGTVGRENEGREDRVSRLVVKIREVESGEMRKN